MKVIAQRFWREPAVCIGALCSVAVLVLALVTGADWDIAQIAGVLGPFAAALGIRPMVTPAG